MPQKSCHSKAPNPDCPETLEILLSAAARIQCRRTICRHSVTYYKNKVETDLTPAGSEADVQVEHYLSTTSRRFLGLL